MAFSKLTRIMMRTCWFFSRSQLFHRTDCASRSNLHVPIQAGGGGAALKLGLDQLIPSLVGLCRCLKMPRVYMSMSTGRTSPVLFSFTHSSRSLDGSTFCSSWSTGSTT